MEESSNGASEVSMTSDLDAKERKRLQNRLAQRTYRQNQKQRLRLLEQAAEQVCSRNATMTAPYAEAQKDDYRDQQTWSDITAVCPKMGTEESRHLKYTYPPLFSDPSAPELQINEGGTALHRAARNGNEALVRLLLDHGADIERQDNDGQTVLHTAAKSGSQPIVQLILDARTTVDIKDHVGRTALFSAVQSGNDAVVKMLLEASSDPNCTDSMGNVALHWAVDMNSESITLLLLSFGAEVNA
ncbi:hypothetical protein H634G_08185 [Metarhizium anisopliae BRIP 53293]|uniref:Uncharacterized protein n=1 Tax=Metarhizium anisopliae BRIP 53293 TaxID=1291518 RepID=A0A0D9NRF1_METAN|nr:hypothetical protein H634G_08185 [Metarhizium anisopliae BRIP 53293]KJK87326.1 hypothetical protein H633G_08840 [Metarhizium anisopliae BRIP 53284]